MEPVSSRQAVSEDVPRRNHAADILHWVRPDLAHAASTLNPPPDTTLRPFRTTIASCPMVPGPSAARFLPGRRAMTAVASLPGSHPAETVCGRRVARVPRRRA